MSEGAKVPPLKNIKNAWIARHLEDEDWFPSLNGLAKLLSRLRSAVNDDVTGWDSSF